MQIVQANNVCDFYINFIIIHLYFPIMEKPNLLGEKFFS